MPCMRMLCDAAPTAYSMCKCMEVYQEATSAIYPDRHRFFVGMIDTVLRLGHHTLILHRGVLIIDR